MNYSPAMRREANGLYDNLHNGNTLLCLPSCLRYYFTVGKVVRLVAKKFLIIIIMIIFIYLPSDVISQEKTATSSRSITKASKYAIPLKPTHKLAESKRYLVTW